MALLNLRTSKVFKEKVGFLEIRKFNDFYNKSIFFSYINVYVTITHNFLFKLLN